MDISLTRFSSFPRLKETLTWKQSSLWSQKPLECIFSVAIKMEMNSLRLTVVKGSLINERWRQETELIALNKSPNRTLINLWISIHYLELFCLQCQYWQRIFHFTPRRKLIWIIRNLFSSLADFFILNWNTPRLQSHTLLFLFFIFFNAILSPPLNWNWDFIAKITIGDIGGKRQKYLR